MKYYLFINFIIFYLTVISFSFAYSNPSTQMAMEFYLNKQFTYSLPYFEYAYRNESINSRFYIRYGITLINTAHYTAAIDILTTGLIHYPQEKDLHYNLALAYYWLGNIELAGEHFKIESKINPQNARAFYMYGYVHSRLNNLEKADRYMSKAFKIDPNSKMVSAGYNGFLTRWSNSLLANNPQKALKLAQKADLVFKNNPRTYEILGMLYFQKEQFHKSVKASERLIELKPHIAIYRNNLAYALLFAEGANQALRAKQEVESAIRLNPDMRYNFLTTWALAEFYLGNYAEAQSILDELIENLSYAGLPQQTHAALYYIQGEILFEIGEKESAQKYFRKSIGYDIDIVETRLAKKRLKKL